MAKSQTDPRLPATQVRNRFSETLDQIGKGQRIVVTNHGREIAAIVPIGDARLLAKLEDVFRNKK